MEAALVPPTWSPNQLKSIEALGLDLDLRRLGQRPTFAPDLPGRLRAQLEHGLGNFLASTRHSSDDPLVLSKFALGEVFRCERRYCSASEEQFRWNIPKARGTVLHKVLQASSASRARKMPSPVLVEQAIERLKRDPENSISVWLNELTEFELAELQVEVTELFIKVRADLPPLGLHWQPRAETRARAELCSGRCVCVAKFDLALGTPQGLEARTFVVDFKTGGVRNQHQDDMRFYALIETLRSNIPPWRMAVYYIDTGTWICMDIDEEILGIAVRRTLDGAKKIAELSRGIRPPQACSHPCSVCEEHDGDGP